MEKKCITCKHFKKNLLKDPCNVCMGFSANTKEKYTHWIEANKFIIKWRLLTNAYLRN